MKIIVAAPLFPPETRASATYTKEFAKRASTEHSVTVVTYAHRVESIENVEIKTTDKHLPLPLRLIAYLFSLWRASKNADVLYIQETIATGVPAVIVSKLRNIPYVLHAIEDELYRRAASRSQNTLSFTEYMQKEKQATSHSLLSFLMKLVLTNASKVLCSSEPVQRWFRQQYDVDGSSLVLIHEPLPKEPVLPMETASSAAMFYIPTTLESDVSIRNLNDLLNALKKEIPSAHLVASGPLPHTDNMAMDKIAEGIVIKGPVSTAELYYLAKEACAVLITDTIILEPHTLLTLGYSTPMVYMSDSIDETVNDLKRVAKSEEDRARTIQKQNQKQSLHDWEHHMNDMYSYFTNTK